MCGGTPRGGRKGALVALATVACLAALSEGSCSLILDFSAATDAGPVDAAADAGDDGDPCAFLEPNDDLADAVMIEPGTYRLGICPTGDEDYFRFDIDDGQDLFVEIRFDSAEGDLILRLYQSSDGLVVSTSNSFDDVERIDHNEEMGNQLEGGTYTVEVSAQAAGATNEYTMDLSVRAPPDLADAGPPDA